MKKLLSLSLLLAALCTAAVTLSACGQKTENYVYYLNFKPEVAEVYERIAKDYKAETGVELRVVTAASGTYEQKLKSEIAKSDAPTIFQINGPRGYAAWKDYCADLKGSELYAHLSDKALAITDGDGVYGIPYVVEGYGIIYNDAIMRRYFALPEKATDFTSMEEINTFAKLKTLVEDMTALKNELDIEGVFASTSLQTGENWRWQTHLPNIPLYYEWRQDGKNTATDDLSTVELRYGQEFRNIFDLYLQNSVTDPKLLGSKQVSDSMAEFALGRCAMVQNGNWAWSQINGVSGNTVAEDDIRFLPIYTGISGEEDQGLCIGTENYLAINKEASEEKQQLALDFLTWLFTSDTGRRYVVEELNFIAPFDTFTAEYTPADPLAKEVLRYMNDPEKQNIDWIFTVFPSDNFKKTLGSALLQYAQGNADWEQVSDTFRREWERESRS